MVGAAADDETGSNSGSAYVFRGVEPQTWFEEDDPAITYSGPWRTRTCPTCSGGSFAFSPRKRARADFAFEGTGLRII